MILYSYMKQLHIPKINMALPINVTVMDPSLNYMVDESVLDFIIENDFKKLLIPENTYISDAGDFLRLAHSDGYWFRIGRKIYLNDEEVAILFQLKFN